MRKVLDTIPEVFHLGRLKGHDLNEITIEQLQRLLSEDSTERLTSVEYVKFCLDRIGMVRNARRSEAAIHTLVYWADDLLKRSIPTWNASSKSILMLKKLL